MINQPPLNSNNEAGITRYYWLLLAESHLTRRLFAEMLRNRDAAAAAGIRRGVECSNYR